MPPGGPQVGLVYVGGGVGIVVIGAQEGPDRVYLTRDSTHWRDVTPPGSQPRNGDPGHWIVDGNYGGTLDIRLARADTAIILDLPRLVCTTRALRRSIVNRGRSIQAEGCPERLDLDFLRWVWRYPTDSRPRLDAALRAHGGHLEVVKLTSAREVRQFLHQVGPAQRADADRGKSGHE